MSITTREFLTAIANGDWASAEVIQYAKNELQKIDDRNSRRQNYEKERVTEAEKCVLEVLKNNPKEHMTVREIAEQIGEFSCAKITATLLRLVNNGEVCKTIEKRKYAYGRCDQSVYALA